MAKGGIWVEAEGLTLLQINILPAAELEDNICVLSKDIIPCPVLAAACHWCCRRRWGVPSPTLTTR